MGCISLGYHSTNDSNIDAIQIGLLAICATELSTGSFALNLELFLLR